MNLFILLITLKQYQNVGSVVVFILWIYLIVQSIKDVSDYKKASGEPFRYLFNPFNNKQLKGDVMKNNDLASLAKRIKSRRWKLFLLWILVGFTYVIGAAIISHF